MSTFYFICRPWYFIAHLAAWCWHIGHLKHCRLNSVVTLVQVLHPTLSRGSSFSKIIDTVVLYTHGNCLNSVKNQLIVKERWRERRRKSPRVSFRASPLINYLFKGEVGKNLEGKLASWYVMGKEREEQGTGYCCKTKEPVFTGPDSKHIFPNMTVCLCVYILYVRACVCVVSKWGVWRSL